MNLPVIIHFVKTNGGWGQRVKHYFTIGVVSFAFRLHYPRTRSSKLGPRVGFGGMTKRNTLSQLEVELRSPTP
jgi:hypothetical protein